MRLVTAALSIWLALGVSAMAQGARIGAYPSGSGPNGPGIGAYPEPDGTPPGPVESAQHHDQKVEYCRSQPGACTVKQPDNHDLAQHQLDETTAPQRENAPQPPAAPAK